MPNWKQKSESSYEAATKLIEASFPNPSVHCSYYSCVQYIFHVMKDYFGMDVEHIQNQSVSSVNKRGTHRWIRNEIFNSLGQQDKVTASIFNDYIGRLKVLRVKADYHFNLIGNKEANKAQKLASDILIILKDKYEV